MKLLITLALAASAISGLLVSQTIQDPDNSKSSDLKTQFELMSQKAELQRRAISTSLNELDELQSKVDPNNTKFLKTIGAKKKEMETTLQQLRQNFTLFESDSKSSAPNWLKTKLRQESKKTDQVLSLVNNRLGNLQLMENPMQRFGLVHRPFSSKNQHTQNAVDTSLRKLAGTEDSDEREQLTEEIREQLKTIYNEQLTAKESRLEELKSKLETMESQLESRRQAADELIDLRLKLLVKQAELGDFNDSPARNVIWGLRSDVNPATPPTRPTLPTRLGDRSWQSQGYIQKQILKAETELHAMQNRLGNGHPDVEELRSRLQILRKGPPSLFTPKPPETGGGWSFSGSIDISDSDDDEANITFVSKKELRDGKLTIQKVGDDNTTISISFDNVQEAIYRDFEAGNYKYKYEQDGEFPVEGIFKAVPGEHLIIEIETGKSGSEILEEKIGNVVFDSPDSEAQGTLWIRGLQSGRTQSFKINKPNEPLKCRCVPEKYLFVFIGEDSNRISTQNFSVKPGETKTIDFLKSKKERGSE